MNNTIRIDRAELETLKGVCADLQIDVYVLEECIDNYLVRVKIQNKYTWQLFYVGYMLATRMASKSLLNS